MGRPKDKFWEHAQYSVGGFVCNYCQKVFTGSISRVKSHLSGQTGRDIAVCEKVPKDVQESAISAICSNKKIKTGSSSDVRANDVCSTPCITSSNGLYQSTNSEICKNENKDMVDKLVGKAFIMNNIPLDVIQSPSFIAMCKGIADHGPGYTLPRDLLLGSKKDVEEYMSKVKESWASTGCTLMLACRGDEWGLDVYVYVIAYSPGGVVFLKVDSVGLYSEGELLFEVLEEIDGENVVQIIIHDDSFSDKDFDLIVEKYPHIHITSCTGGGIQFLSETTYPKGFGNGMKEIFYNAKLIVDCMHSHTIITDLMRELKKPGKSRFVTYSNFLMLQSIVEAKDDLRALVVSSEWRGMDRNRSPQAQIVEDIIRSSSFWDEGRDILSILEPLIKVFLLVNCDGSTTSYLYVAMERAREVIKSRCDNDRTKYLDLWELFDSRKENILHQLHAVASFFNPSVFYNGKIMYDIPEVKDGMNYVVEKLIQQDERANFASQLLLYTGKSTKLFDTLSLELMTLAHPRVWWELNGGEVPLLRKIAIRILSLPCGSSLCEQIWRELELVVTDTASNKLTPDMWEELVYIRMNLLMMTNLDKFKMRHQKAIDLDKLDELAEEFENEVLMMN